MAGSNESIVAGSRPAVSKPFKRASKRALHYFRTAALAVLAGVSAAKATELLLQKGQAFTTSKGTSISPDSLLAQQSGKYGVLLNIKPSTGPDTAISMREGDSTVIDNTNIKFLTATVGARSIWFDFDTSSVIQPDTTFRLTQGQPKDTLGATITVLDFSNVQNLNGSYSALLSVQTARGTSIIELGAGESKSVLVDTVPGTAILIKAVKTNPALSGGSVNLQVAQISTVQTISGGMNINLYGYDMHVTEISQITDSTGTRDVVLATVRTPEDTIFTQAFEINKPVSMIDTATNTGVSITMKSATQAGNSISVDFIAEKIQNASVFALGQTATDSAIGTMKLIGAHDSVAVFEINGDTVEAVVGKRITFLGSSGRTIKFTVQALSIGRSSAYATVNVEAEAPTIGVRPSNGISAMHTDRIIQLSQNRYGLIFAKPGAHTVSVYNIQGRLVASLPCSGSRAIVDFSRMRLSAGRYILSVNGMSALGQCIGH
jgi:hypothetical protein